MLAWVCTHALQFTQEADISPSDSKSFVSQQREGGKQVICNVMDVKVLLNIIEY